MQTTARQPPTISGSPLSPAELNRLGVLGTFAPAPKSFDPGGAWVHTYRVLTCHGYVERGNTVQGYLRIGRKPGERTGAFHLAVDQRILQANGVVHWQDAGIRCALNAVATPIEWTLTSRFLDAAGSEIPAFTLDEEGRLPDYDDGPGREPKRAGSPPALVTSDWCLFEAVQRLPFGLSTERRFDLLDGLSVLRRGHRIAYRGRDSAIEGVGSTHRFTQSGRGVLPFDYWLDEGHRLVLAATFSRAFVLDENAEALFQEAVAQAGSV